MSYFRWWRVYILNHWNAPVSDFHNAQELSRKHVWPEAANAVVFFAAFKMRSHAYLKLRFLWLHLNSDSEYRRWVFVTHLLGGKESFLKNNSFWVQTWVWMLINLLTLGILASLSGWALPPHSEKLTYRWRGKGFKKKDIFDYTSKNMLIV